MLVYFNRVIRSTDKAVLVETRSREQLWVPRSAITEMNREYHEATIADWFVQKHPRLAAPAKRQQRKPRFAHYSN